MSIEAMKQALEALESVEKVNGWNKDSVIAKHCKEILRQAIAKAEKQEPKLNSLDWWALFDENQRLRAELKFNTKLTKNEWVGLTFTEYMQAIKGKEDIEDCWRSIEAKLKEKNG